MNNAEERKEPKQVPLEVLPSLGIPLSLWEQNVQKKVNQRIENAEYDILRHSIYMSGVSVEAGREEMEESGAKELLDRATANGKKVVRIYPDNVTPPSSYQVIKIEENPLNQQIR